MSDEEYYSETEEGSDEESEIINVPASKPVKNVAVKYDDDDSEPDDAEESDEEAEDLNVVEPEDEEETLVESDDESDTDIEDEEDLYEGDLDENIPEAIIPKKKNTDKKIGKKQLMIIDEDEEEEDEEYNDNYLEKFDTELVKNYIDEFHPECLSHNYDEIAKLSNVVRNSDGIIIDPFHKTIPYLTKYEKARILGQRAKQIETGSKPFIKVPENIVDGYIIAELELKEKKMPFIIKRPIPGGACEYWSLKDLEVIAF